MKTRVCLPAVIFFSMTLFAGETQSGAASPPQAQQPQMPTVASDVDAEVSRAERQVVEVAEAMPEEKFNFTPEGLNISGLTSRGCGLLPSR
jgi:hypothetical protein